MHKFFQLFLACPENSYHPLAMSYKAFILYAIILILIRLLIGSAQAESAAVDSKTLMNLINQQRQNRNMGALFIHQSLTTAAQEKSQDMIERDYFAHIDPDGNYVWPRIVAAGYSPYRVLGENLAIGFSTSEGMVQAWLDSPTHRENLLNNQFIDQGLIALYGDYKNSYTNLTTSLFGTLAVQGQAPPPAVVPPTQNPPPQPPSPPSPTPVQTPPAPPPSPLPNEEPAETAPDHIEEPTKQTNEGDNDGLASLDPGKIKFPEIPTNPSGEPSEYMIARIVFTFFGLGLLALLAVNSAIVYRHRAVAERSHASYHVLAFIAIIIISLIVWWWQ